MVCVRVSIVFYLSLPHFTGTKILGSDVCNAHLSQNCPCCTAAQVALDWSLSSVLTYSRFLDYLPKDIAFVVRSLKVTIPQRAFDTKEKLDAGIQFDRPTIFATLLNSDLEEVEKRPERLADEAITVTAAGTETTSWTLSVITYHLLDKPKLLDRLLTELRANIDDPKSLPRWTTLEKLPYLGAVIQEGLRLSYGVSGPIALEAPEEDLVYRGEFQKKPIEILIPRGSAMAMSNFINHHNESVFPDSHAFIPERWLDQDMQGGRNKSLEKGMMAFSKGPRACMGKKYVDPNPPPPSSLKSSDG